VKVGAMNQLSEANPYPLDETGNVETNGFLEDRLATILEAVAREAVSPAAFESSLKDRRTGPRILRGTRVLAFIGLAIGVSVGGVAIADAISSSPERAFFHQESSQPRVTSPLMLDRGGHRVELSHEVGETASSDDLTTSLTLGDGTVLTPPPADATAEVEVSEAQAWSAFEQYGSPPNIYVLPSTPAPVFQLAELSKSNAPTGGALNTLVWAIDFQDISLFFALPDHEGQSSANPADDIGYLYVFVDAETGRVLYTTASSAKG
jgi:hypothetical protein